MVTKTIEFTGVLSGDCECFCWDGVPEETWMKILKTVDEFDIKGRVYPGDVLSYLGCDYDKKYKFTITIEKA